MAKKEKPVPKVGITGVGEDYSIYKLNLVERMTGFAIGFAGGFLAAQIMFSVIAASVAIGVVMGIAAMPLYRKYLQNRRKKLLLLQFRDSLDALANSFSSGRNTPNAFADAYMDLKNAYGEDAPMTKEFEIVLNGLNNNYVIEDLLRDMADRCAIDDINSFAETFAVCNRLGGNLKKIVSDTRDIISDKIEIEMEIGTTVSASKNDINIMCVLPFIVIAMMRSMGNSAITDNSSTNVVVKLIAVGMFAAAYALGRKITNIKV